VHLAMSNVSVGKFDGGHKKRYDKYLNVRSNSLVPP